MAMPAVQRNRYERVEVCDMGLGMYCTTTKLKRLPESADGSTGKSTRHDDADWQPVPGGAN